ncbi:hypothetical protein ACIRPQ_05755 [Streptomyces sp. NPDC101213]
MLDAVPAMMTYRSEVCGSEWGDRGSEEATDRFMLPPLRPEAG